MSNFRKNIFLCILLFIFTLMSSKAISQVIQISPDYGLDFGRIPENKNAERDLLIYNLSVSTLEITNLSIDGQNASNFSLVEDPGTVSLGPLEMLILPIRFNPSAEGDYSAQVVIESNAGSSPDHAELLGIGTDLDYGFIGFERIFGGTKQDGVGSVRVTPDGGFILAGSTSQIGREYGDATLIKTDAYGQIEWRKIYGIEDWSEGFAEGILAQDGGYIAAGTKTYADKNREPDIRVLKTDESGVAVWDSTYGIEDSKDTGSYIIATSDGGYLVAGNHQYNTPQRVDQDAYLIKIDVNGHIEWEQFYGGEEGDGASCVRETADGSFLFCGSTSSYSTGGTNDLDGQLIKIDAQGNQVWRKTYGAEDWDDLNYFIFTDDGGMILVGFTASPSFDAQSRDVYIVKTDAEGNEQWHRVYGDAHKDGASSVVQARDGGYLVVGGIENYYVGGQIDEWRSDIYLLNIDANGDLLWSKTYGGNHEEGASCIQAVDDGGYIISGVTHSYSKDSDVYLLKIDWAGGFSSVPMSSKIIPEQFQLAQNYPNPFNNQTAIEYRLSKKARVSIKLYNVQGQLVRSLIDQKQNAGSYTIQVDARDLTSGLYFYQLSTEDFTETKRMILLK